MRYQGINTGTTANDGTGDLLRNAFNIVNGNFEEVDAIPIGRSIDHTDSTLIADDINTYIEANDAGGAITLNITTGIGAIGDWIIVRKVGATNDITITHTGGTLKGAAKITEQYAIIHLMKTAIDEWTATGGAS